MELSQVTAEILCAAMSPASWSYTRGADRELQLANAQRHLDAIRAIVAAQASRELSSLGAADMASGSGLFAAIEAGNKANEAAQASR